MYQNANIEISGVCNAKCRYCVTGIANRKKEHRGGVMAFDEFKSIYVYLRKKKIIGSVSNIGLFNWGEPFINPDLEKICCFLSENNQPFHLSTNASIYRPIVKSMKTLTSMTFSMCGFSQKSYDRIHGFKFNSIVGNIEKYVADFKKYGYGGNLYIAYHIYQFNREEMLEAYRYARKIGIGIHFSYAFLNGVSLGLNYMDSLMDYKELKQMGKDIDIGYLDELIAEKDENEVCKELGRLVIDEAGNVLMCCGVDKKCANYAIGNVFDFDNASSISNKREAILRSSKVCRRCIDSGLHYWIHNPPAREIKDNMFVELIYKLKSVFKKYRLKVKKCINEI